MATAQMKRIKEEINLFASDAGYDAVRLWLKKSEDELENAGISKDKAMALIFGLAKRKGEPWKTSNHRAVYIECNGVVFKLDLYINHANGKEAYLNLRDTFTCPDERCNFRTDSFAELNDHHWKQLHRNEEGDNIRYKCCKREFGIYESYSDHIYRSHINFTTVSLKFKKIDRKIFEERYDIKEFSKHTRLLSFQSILRCAADIVLNFGRYYVFVWNCQDFATWFLLNVGIPLDIIDPTIPDYITGTGTSGHSVQKVKSWKWYREPDQLKQHDLEHWGGGYSCDTCQFIPAMSIEALKRHHDMVHSGLIKKQRMDGLPPDEDLLHVACGIDIHLDLEEHLERQYTLYQIQDSKLHTSLVLQPWVMLPSGLTRPSNFYHIVEMVNLNGIKRLCFKKLKVRHIPKLNNIGSIKLSINSLLHYVKSVFNMSKHCIEFFTDLRNSLLDKSIVVRLNIAENNEANTEKVIPEKRGQKGRLIHEEVVSRRLRAIFREDNSPREVRGIPKVVSWDRHAKTQLILVTDNFRMMSLFHPILILCLMSFETIGILFTPWLIGYSAIMANSVAIDYLRNQGIVRLIAVAKSSEWRPKIEMFRGLSYLVSIFFSFYETFDDLETLVSTFFLQYIWIVLILLDERNMARVTNTYAPLHNVPEVFALLKGGVEDTLPLILIMFSLFFSPPLCILGILLSIIAIILLSVDTILPKWFGSPIPFSYLTGDGGVIANRIGIASYVVSTLIVMFNGIVRFPDLKLSKFHILTIYIYIILPWLMRQTLGTVRRNNEIIVADSLCSEVNSRENALLSGTWLPIIKRLNVACKVSLFFLCSVPICVIFLLDTHTCFVVTVICIYTHFVLYCLMLDVQQVLLYVIELTYRNNLPPGTIVPVKVGKNRKLD